MIPIDFKGMDLIRSRDCVTFVKGRGFAVSVSPSMLRGGWIGGQGVQWDSSTPDNPQVTYSKGLFGGFMLWGSDETADQFNAMTGQYLKYGYGVMMTDRALISTVAFEQYTYASRTIGGPFVPLTYLPGEALYFSLRGLWTKEDELTLSSDPLAPAFFSGFVAQIPKAVNESHLGVQTRL